MISSLLRKLTGAEAAPLTKDEERMAVAALLVIAAHADHQYEEVERAQIERLLASRYGLDPAAAAALRVAGEAAEAASTDLYRFTATIKSKIAHEERLGVIEAMWRIVLADGKRDMHEEALMRRVADLLGVDPRESIEARRRIEREVRS